MYTLLSLASSRYASHLVQAHMPSSEAPVLSYGVSSSRNVCTSRDPDRRPAAGGACAGVAVPRPRILLPTQYWAAVMVGSVPWIAYGEEHTGNAVCAAGRHHIAQDCCVVVCTLFIRLIVLRGAGDASACRTGRAPTHSRSDRRRCSSGCSAKVSAEAHTRP
jgi:hypothetical protein